MIKFLGKRSLLPNLTATQIKPHPYADHLPRDIPNKDPSASTSGKKLDDGVVVLESLFQLPLRFQRKEISELEMSLINGGGAL